MVSCRLDLEVGIRAFEAGQVLAYPTEGVWGLGCLPAHGDTLERLLALKERDPDKGLILIAAQLSDLASYIRPLGSSEQKRLMQTETPVTWLVPAAPGAPPLLRGAHDTQAIRLTRHALCRTLCERLGALVSTSANVEGAPPACTAEEVEAMFGDNLDGVIEGELGGAAGPSEIRDLSSGRVLRALQPA